METRPCKTLKLWTVSHSGRSGYLFWIPFRNMLFQFNKNKHMHTNINMYISYYTCNNNINIPIHNSFLVASVLHILHIIARCKETTKHPCYKYYVGHCLLSKMQYSWYTERFSSWLYDHLHVNGHCTDISFFFIIVTLMVTFGIKPKTFPSSYHMSLAVIPVPQVQFQPSPLIWKKKKISKLCLCNSNQLPKNGSNVNSQNVV